MSTLRTCFGVEDDLFPEDSSRGGAGKKRLPDLTKSGNVTRAWSWAKGPRPKFQAHTKLGFFRVETKLGQKITESILKIKNWPQIRLHGHCVLSLKKSG